MAVKGEWLFVLVCSFTQDEEVDTALAGIHVLNQSDLVEESVFRGNFVRMACPEGSDYIVASSQTREMMNVFSVEDGCLVLIRSFFVASVSYDHQMLVSGSLVYTTNRRAEHIHVFDINNGEEVGRFNFPAFDAFNGVSLTPTSLETNGREIFCGFTTEGHNTRSMSAIKVYPACIR